jgi:hypothetical protein
MPPFVDYRDMKAITAVSAHRRLRQRAFRIGIVSPFRREAERPAVLAVTGSVAIEYR